MSVTRSHGGASLSAIFEPKSMNETVAWAIEAAKHHRHKEKKSLFRFAKKIQKHIERE
jgi:hypothetical protein